MKSRPRTKTQKDKLDATIEKCAGGIFASASEIEDLMAAIASDGGDLKM